MLRELRIKNFAIIEEQTVEFDEGLNILSGETGSGKSLVLEAFRLVLGGRASSDYFRAGTDGWEVDALIDLDSVSDVVRASLPDIVRDSEELAISRSMTTQGRSRVYINGRISSLAVLQSITPHVIALCTQGQQMQLTDSQYLLYLIDEYGDAIGDREDYQVDFRALNERQQELRKLQEKKESIVRRQAELEFILQELAEVAPHKGMRAELEEAISQIKSHKERVEILGEARHSILSERGILSEVDRVRALLTKVNSESQQEEWETLLTQMSEDASALEKSIRIFSEQGETTSLDLSELQAQLSELARLERKFKTDDEGLAILYESALKEQEEVESDERERELVSEINELQDQLVLKAGKLGKKRRSVGIELQKLITTELKDLEMKGASITISFESHDLEMHGAERVHFMFQPNPGEEEKPLSQIASGGELSRVMLILKKLLRDRSGVSILVFDEVDSGISGAVAQAVGKKLMEISKFSQLICITHLPQVACFADQHYSIKKESVSDGDGSEERTRTVIDRLSDKEKVEEIARMLAGYKITAAARASAKELLSSKKLAA